MKDKIEKLNSRLDELNKTLSEPDIHNDLQRFKDVSREQNDLSQIMITGNKYLNVLNNYEGNQAIINDDEDTELVELAQLEQEELSAEIEQLEEELGDYTLYDKNVSSFTKFYNGIKNLVNEKNKKSSKIT